MLYNIFSTFGNIERMIFFKDKSSVLIEYQKIEQASIAKDYMNDIRFQGNQIKVDDLDFLLARTLGPSTRLRSLPGPWPCLLLAGWN